MKGYYLPPLLMPGVVPRTRAESLPTWRTAPIERARKNEVGLGAARSCDQFMQACLKTTPLRDCMGRDQYKWLCGREEAREARTSFQVESRADETQAKAELYRAQAQAEIEKAKVFAAAEGEKLKLEAERIKVELAKAQQPQQIVTTSAPVPPPAPRETPEEKAAQMKLLAETIKRETAWPWWTWLVVAGVVGGGLYLYSQTGGTRRAAPAFA